MTQRFIESQPKVRNFWIIIISIAFILSAVFSCFIVPIWKIANNPQIFYTSLSDQNIYELLNENGLEFLQKMGAFPNGILNIDPVFMQGIISRALPSEWWQENISTYLNRYDRYINNKDLENIPFINFATLKSFLQSSDARVSISTEINSYPTCTEVQTQNTTSILDGASGVLPLCMVDDNLIGSVLNFLQSQLAQLGRDVPEDYRLNINFDNSIIQGIKITRSIFDVSIITGLFALVLFGTLTIIIFNNNKRRYLRWMGKLFSITGIIGIVFDLFLFLSANSTLSDIILKMLSGFPLVMVEPLNKVMLQIITVCVYYFGLPSIAFATIGLLLLISARIIPDKKVIV